MAFASTLLSAEPRAFSVGPLKIEIHTYSVASGDTTGTVTATNLSSISAIMIDGVAGVATAAPTFSANVATLAFVNPAATRYGTITIYGK